MEPRTPDEVLFDYLALRRKVAAPQASSLVLERGLVFTRGCPQCRLRKGAKRVQEQLAVPGSFGIVVSRWLCDRCRVAWPVDVGHLLRSSPRSAAERRGSRLGGRPVESQFVALASLGSMLSRLDDVERRIYLQLYLWEDLGAYAAVADEANRRWPDWKPPQPTGPGRRASAWTEWTVRQVVASARRKLREFLR